MSNDYKKHDHERREFLKQFVKASGMAMAGPIFFTACGPSSSPAYGPVSVAYGPPPFFSNTVDLMTYAVPGGAEKELFNNVDVPLNAYFFIYFVHNMDPASEGEIFLLENDQELNVTYEWVSSSTSILKVTPENPLTAGMTYSLIVSDQVIFSDPQPTDTSTDSTTIVFFAQQDLGNQHDDIP